MFVEGPTNQMGAIGNPFEQYKLAKIIPDFFKIFFVNFSFFIEIVPVYLHNMIKIGFRLDVFTLV